MKNKIVLVFLTLYPFAMFAQIGIFIEPSVNYGKTSIYNKEDKKGYVHNAGHVNTIYMIPTYKPSYGVNLGICWDKQKTSLSTFGFGLHSMIFLQKFDAVEVTNTNYYGPLTASTELNYLCIPLHTKFRFGNSKYFVPTLTAGLNINLLQNYTDLYYASLTNKQDSTKLVIKQSVINNRLELWNPIPSKIVDLNSWYYNKVVFCSYLKFGFDYNITPKMNLNLGIDNIISFNNPENREEITGESVNTGLDIKIKPYESYIYKIFSRNYTNDKRGTTYLIRSGINLSFSYKFIKN
jgi:hypothetical protein